LFTNCKIPKAESNAITESFSTFTFLAINAPVARVSFLILISPFGAKMLAKIVDSFLNSTLVFLLFSKR